MFRIKTKKKTGSAARKRKDFEDAEENGELMVDETKSEPMEVDDVEITGANGPVLAANDPLKEDTGGDEDEDAMLARMRSRLQKNKTKSVNAMSFSSKTSSGAKKYARVRVPLEEEDEENGETSGSASLGLSSTGGCLSFEEDAGAGNSKTKKMRIRPNLSVAKSNDEDDEEADATTNPYSQDMLASLLREQKVLLRRAPPTAPTVDLPVEGMDVDEEGVEGVVLAGVDEETKGESADEEFIPLNAKIMQQQKNKKRVTFGVPNDEYYPPKTAEVEEPVPTSDIEEDEEADQSKRWEEELMRRGGGHHIPPLKPKTTSFDSKAAYPTRRSVPCASLGEVMRSIQRKMEAGSIERDRVTRELARLDAESELIHKKLQQQREEHLVSSEQFEYFQVIEDFVKGLSFCLREKLPSIEDEEKRRLSLWESSRTSLRDQREVDIRGEIRATLEANVVQERQFVHLPSSFREQIEVAGNDSEADTRLARLRRRYDGTYESIDSTSQWHIFADAVDEINSLDRVYGRFQEWKSKFPDIYKDAYTDLAVTKLYAPYIRVELMNWDPLAVSLAASAMSGFPKRVSEMQWLKTVQQHRPLHGSQMEEHVIALLRDIVINRIAEATKSRFDAFSPVHTQSVVDLIEDLVQLNAGSLVDADLRDIIGNVVAALTGEAKRLPLLALDQQEATHERTRFFASYLVGDLCGLLENALTLFVSLPSGPLHERGFNAVMQILHHVLAYVTHCKHLNKTATLPQIQRTIQQLSSSSFMQSLLARSTREQLEFQRVLVLLTSAT